MFGFIEAPACVSVRPAVEREEDPTIKHIHCAHSHTLADAKRATVSSV